MYAVDNNNLKEEAVTKLVSMKWMRSSHNSSSPTTKSPPGKNNRQRILGSVGGDGYGSNSQTSRPVNQTERSNENFSSFNSTIHPRVSTTVEENDIRLLQPVLVSSLHSDARVGEKSKVHACGIDDPQLIASDGRYQTQPIKKSFFRFIPPSHKRFDEFCFANEHDLRLHLEKMNVHRSRTKNPASSKLTNVDSLKMVSSSLNVQAKPFWPQKSNNSMKNCSNVSNRGNVDTQPKIESQFSSVKVSIAPSSSSQINALTLDCSKKNADQRGDVVNRFRLPLSRAATFTTVPQQNENCLDARSQIKYYLQRTLKEIDAQRLNNFNYFQDDNGCVTVSLNQLPNRNVTTMAPSQTNQYATSGNGLGCANSAAIERCQPPTQLIISKNSSFVTAQRSCTWPANDDKDIRLESDETKPMFTVAATTSSRASTESAAVTWNRALDANDAESATCFLSAKPSSALVATNSTNDAFVSDGTRSTPNSITSRLNNSKSNSHQFFPSTNHSTIGDALSFQSVQFLSNDGLRCHASDFNDATQSTPTQCSTGITSATVGESRSHLNQPFSMKDAVITSQQDRSINQPATVHVNPHASPSRYRGQLVNNCVTNATSCTSIPASRIFSISQNHFNTTDPRTMQSHSNPVIQAYQNIRVANVIDIDNVRRVPATSSVANAISYPNFSLFRCGDSPSFHQSDQIAVNSNNHPTDKCVLPAVRNNESIANAFVPVTTPFLPQPTSISSSIADLNKPPRLSLYPRIVEYSTTSKPAPANGILKTVFTKHVTEPQIGFVEKSTLLENSTENSLRTSPSKKVTFSV